MFDFIHHLDVVEWVSTLGYFGLLIIIFVETGLFFGFFLPGDSLVFAAGLLASKHIFNIWILIPLLVVVAIIGYTVGYWFGDKLGHWLMKRKDSIWFKKRYLQQAHEFYEKHGGKALVIGRLVPIMRTFVPIVAGMAQMRYRSYLTFNVLGALVWGGGITFAGYYIGALIPNAGHYLFPFVLLIIFLSILPGIIHFLKKRKGQTK